MNNAPTEKCVGRVDALRKAASVKKPSRARTSVETRTQFFKIVQNTHAIPFPVNVEILAFKIATAPQVFCVQRIGAVLVLGK